MTLARKIPFSLLVFGLSMMFASYFMLFKSDGLLKSHTLRGLEREVRMLTTLIEQNLLERYHNAKMFPLVLGEIEPEELGYMVTDPEFLDSLNQLVMNYKVYRRIAIVDPQGYIIAQNSKNHLGKTIFTNNIPREEIIRSDWFRALSDRHNRTDEVYFYGPNKRIIDTSENQYDLLIGSRIYSRDGELMGFWLNILDFAIVESNVEYVYQLLADKGLTRVELTLLDSKGNVIVDFDPITQQSAEYRRDFSILGKLNLPQAGVEGAQLAVAGLTGSTLSFHARKNIEQFTVYTHFDGYKALPGLGWSTLIRIEENEAYAQSRELRQWNLILFLFSIIAIGIMTLIAVRAVVKPLKKVTNVIKEFSQGNLEPVLEREARKDEVGAINNALCDLKEQLKEREKLLKTNQEQQILVELQKSAIDSMASGIMIIDATHDELPIIFVNRSFEMLTGYRSEEAKRKHFRFLWGDETESFSVQTIEEAIARKEACTCVVTSHRKDGNTFINNLLVDPVFNEHGELTHYIGVLNDITELKKDEQLHRYALEKQIDERTRESREAAKRLRTVFDTALDGSVVMNEKGEIIDVNHSLEVIFGRSKAELMGKNVSILMTPEHSGHHDQYIKNYFAGGIRKFIGELRTVKAQHKSGRVIPIEISIGETRLETETLFVAAIRDITEQQENRDKQQKLQNRLKEREMVYRTAFDQAAVGIARVSLEGKMLEVNKKLCTNLGYTEPELLSLNVADITFQGDIPLSEDYLRDLLNGKYDAYTLDKRYVRKDGSVFWANLSISLVHSEQGEAKYFISVIEDITSRKTIEQDLKDARDQRDELIGGTNLASQAGGICNWSYNLETDELKWDLSTYDLYGVEKDKSLSYADWSDRVFPQDREALEADIEVAIRNRSALESEFRFTRKGETEYRWAKVALAITYNDSGKPVKMFGINIDITDEKRITADLEKETVAAQKANEAKSSFLATMSHEIRTPMNGVIGMIDLLRQTPLNADQKRMATTIRDSSFALLDIINDILDFSKIEAGQIEIDWTPSSILSLMEKTADSMWVSAEDKNVELIVEPDLSTPKEIPLDSVRVRQILLNLVGNAVKFSQRDNRRGVVKIISQYQVKRSRLLLKILDNGIGISPEQLEKLFTPFTQADSSTTRKFGGTGLGLSITKSFVELMDGDIQVESELDQGSCFTVILPVREVGDTETEFSETLFSGMRVYICLGSEHMQLCCAHTIKQLGCSDIHFIEKADSNTIKEDNNKYNVLVCDNQTGAVSGLNTLRTLVIEPDPIKRKGYINPYLFSVAAHPLKPSDLVHGLSVLCGMESPEFEWAHQNSSARESGNQKIMDGFKILLVEDHPTNQLVIGRQLESLGYEYDLADDGVEGLEKWRGGHYSLVLTDCHMPRMDGFDLTKEIRKTESENSLEHTPVVAITANALVGEADTCFEAGMDEYIAKPVEINQLHTKLLKWSRDESAGSVSDENENRSKGEADDTHPDLMSLNYDHLVSVIGTDDKEIINEILTMFWESVQTDLSELRQAIIEEDTSVIKSKAHAAKGSSASSGAMKLSEYFLWIEKNCHDLAGINERIDSIKGELEVIESELTKQGVI